MSKYILFLLVVATVCPHLAFSGEGPGRKRITKETRWLCYYGSDRRVLDVPDMDLLILEAEALGDLAPEDKKGRFCVAYMSIGEVEMNRWYWEMVKDKPWVLEPNPDWPDSRRVDSRSGEWREMLVGMIAPLLLEAGYDGFLLDNVDNAEILLEQDAKRFKGADDATVALIEELRKAFPDAVI
ncbi:MAG: endo alpha-1,4 polygalactosaminidase, partial [Planctomycetota bacterium]|nr:endo alpha-1,4 polygalactosaminidase [Planctomycetota bacterium]